VNAPAEAVFVPPRPNLGPEPLPGGYATSTLILAAIFSIALVLVLARIILRWRRRSRPAQRQSPGLPSGPFATRREQLGAWSAAARQALATRHGPQWSARTTEEIAGDPALGETLGPDLSARLVEFLSEADRAKFDDAEGLQPPQPGPGAGADAAPEWLVAFVGTTAPPSVPAAGARSTIRGK
jgi:hypothetical protein